MTSKRRNNGRAKHGRGRTTPTHCMNCGRLTPKDKAVRRFVVRNILDAASARDVAEASPTLYGAGLAMPKLYMKQRYCIACAVHRKISSGRARKDRKIRYTTKQKFKPKKE